MSDLRLAAARDQEGVLLSFRSERFFLSYQTAFTTGRTATQGRGRPPGQIKGFIIANQNGNASPSGARVLMITACLLLRSWRVRPAEIFHNVFTSEPGALPHSSALGKLHFEEQNSCNGEKESSKLKLMQRRRGGRCHHRQRHAREISPNVGGNPLLAHWEPSGNPILHSAIHRNGVHTTG